MFCPTFGTRIFVKLILKGMLTCKHEDVFAASHAGLFKPFLWFIYVHLVVFFSTADGQIYLVF